MTVQNQILRTLRSSETRLERVMDAHPDAGWTALSRRVCEAFRFHDVKGQPQQAGCLKALRTLGIRGQAVIAGA